MAAANCDNQGWVAFIQHFIKCSNPATLVCLRSSHNISIRSKSYFDYFTKGFGHHQDLIYYIWQIGNKPLSSFRLAVILPMEPIIDAISAQSLFFIVEKWTLTLTEVI